MEAAKRQLMGPPGWLVGPVAAIGAVAILGVQFALFASGGGILFAAAIAFWFGAGIAALIEPQQQVRNALIVAVAIVACLSVFLSMIAFQPAPPGASHGGPAVYPPPSQP